MDENNAITVIAPKREQTIILMQSDAILHLKRRMKKGVHYGPPYPNSKKEVAYKPAAEWIQLFFGLRPEYVEIDKIIQPDLENPERSFILFRYCCRIVDIESGVEVGQAMGSCNSMEDKYHWRKNGNAREPHPNPLDLLNTIDKMAQKRAWMSALLSATGATAYFVDGAINEAYMDADETEVIETEFTELPSNGHGSPQNGINWGQTASIDRLIPFARFMYELDDELAELQDKKPREGFTVNVICGNSIEKAFKEERLTTKDTLRNALVKMLLYRAETDYGYNESDVNTLLKSAWPDFDVDDAMRDSMPGCPYLIAVMRNLDVEQGQYKDITHARFAAIWEMLTQDHIKALRTTKHDKPAASKKSGKKKSKPDPEPAEESDDDVIYCKFCGENEVKEAGQVCADCQALEEAQAEADESEEAEPASDEKFPVGEDIPF